MESITVTSGGAGLAVDVHGPGPSTIVALHPGVGDRRFWRPVADDWAEAGHRVVAYDRRGFGETTYEPAPHDPHDDLAAVCAATADDPVILVGNSMGGTLALEYALDHPEQVAALVIIGSIGSGLTMADWTSTEGELALDAMITAADEAGDVDEVNRLEAHFWLDGPDQPEQRVTGQVRELFLDANGIALRAPDPGEQAEHPATWPRLGNLAMPALIVAGELDERDTRRHSARMAEAAPTARYAELAGTAHCPSLDSPAALSALVLEFLAEIS